MSRHVLIEYSQGQSLFLEWVNLVLRNGSKASRALLLDVAGTCRVPWALPSLSLDCQQNGFSVLNLAAELRRAGGKHEGERADWSPSQKAEVQVCPRAAGRFIFPIILTGKPLSEGVFCEAGLEVLIPQHPAPSMLSGPSRPQLMFVE